MTQIHTFLCRQLADVHGFIENFNGESKGCGKCHLSLLEVLLQHGDGCLEVSKEHKEGQSINQSNRYKVPKHHHPSC